MILKSSFIISVLNEHVHELIPEHANDAHLRDFQAKLLGVQDRLVYEVEL